MRILIIEDEPIAAERLQLMLKSYDASIDVVGCIDSVEDAILWLENNPHPDLMMLDIQLADGFSFEIFRKIPYQKPVIFTTAFNEYALEAFRYFSIDYLIKPFTGAALKQALDKYKTVAQQQQQKIDYDTVMKVLRTYPSNQFKERFLARIGQRFIFVRTADIAYFKADDKIVYLVDKQGMKLPIDYTLEKLETLIDPRQFFRLNRSVIVSIDSIAQIKPYSNSRLMLHLRDGHKSEEMIISRERVPEFRQWAEQ